MASYNSLDVDVAIEEFTQLLHDLESAGLHTEVRPGYDESVLIFVQAPRELLGNMVYHSRWVLSLLLFNENAF